VNLVDAAVTQRACGQQYDQRAQTLAGSTARVRMEQTRNGGMSVSGGY
jgi:hypothetical protein